MSLDISNLDQETKDRLELKEQSEMSFANALDRDYTQILFDTLMYRSDSKNEQSYLASIYGVQGTGKSYSALTMCGFLDKNFDPKKQVFFNYKDVVKRRSEFKSGMAILIDEQKGLYGVDSHRVGILLTALKEQLRKRAIHMFYASPVLRQEHESSMYVFETMFIDKEYDECYMAYKTRELQTLGYVIMPHPSKFLSKEQIKDYEDMKDENLDRLQSKNDIDDVEEMANEVIDSDTFKKAWQVYKNAGRKSLTNSVLNQVVGVVFPEFKGSVITGEVSGRVRFKMEMDGEWTP